MAKKSIHSYVQMDQAYPEQIALLDQLESVWDSSDVVVIEAPTAFGKTLIGDTIARWTSVGSKAGSVIVANNNILVQQLMDNTAGYRTLKRKDLYPCREGGTCEDRVKIAGGCCKSMSGNVWAHDACPYLQDLRGARSAPRLITNQHIYLAHKLYRPTVILDEAHTLQSTLAAMSAVTLWRRNGQHTGWRRPIYSIPDVVDWLSNDLQSGDFEDARLQLLRDVLLQGKPGYTVVLGAEPLRGRVTEFIRLLPLDVKDKIGLFLPPKVSKVVLMSATISSVDIEELGLSGRRVSYIRGKSPIPVSQRPGYFHPVAAMTYNNREAALPKMIGVLLDELLPEYAGYRGLIHAPYALAAEIKRMVGPHPRLKFHTATDKTEVVDMFLSGELGRDAVLVGSGLHEGLDLKGDLARFQAVICAPRPSLADPGMAWLATHAPKRYEWRSVRDTAQAYGRVCRGPTDRGDTYFLDSSLERELNSDLAPVWLSEAIQTI